MAFCGNCGSQFGKDEKFCPSCGNATGSTGTQQSEQGAESGQGSQQTSSSDLSFLRVSSMEDAITLFQEYFLDIVLKKFALFSGRARRREFWTFTLIGLIIGIALAILSAIPILGFIFSLVSWVFLLAVFIPSLALSIRRLHDTNRSGFKLLFGLIPIVGLVLLIIWAAKEGMPEENQYGPDPKAVSSVQ